MSVNMAKHLQDIHMTLDAMVEFFQKHISAEADQIPVLHKFHAIAECMNIKQLVVDTEEEAMIVVKVMKLHLQKMKMIILWMTTLMERN